MARGNVCRVEMSEWCQLPMVYFARVGRRQVTMTRERRIVF